MENPFKNSLYRLYVFILTMLFIPASFYPAFLLGADVLVKVAFDHITVKDGLSQNTVEDVIQDSCGFLWIATQDGLNRYDGYSFTVYGKHMDGLTDNVVWSLLEDSEGYLWIGTQNGLNRWDRKSETFTHYLPDPGNSGSLSDQSARSLYEDRTGTLWIGTSRGGLNKYNRETETFTHYRYDPSDERSLSSDRIISITEDQHGFLWIGTEDAGVNRFDPLTGTVIRYIHDRDIHGSLSGNAVSEVLVDSSNVLWVATEEKGLNRFDPETSTFTTFIHDPKNGSSISSNNIQTIFEDSTGRFWIGHNRGGGLDLFNRQNGQSTHFGSQNHLADSLSDDHIRTIFEDRGGIIWVGTHVGGVNRYDRKQNRFRLYRSQWWTENSLSSDTVRSFYKYGQILYIGTEGGLNELDLTTGNFKHYLFDENSPEGLPHNIVRSLYPDGKGNLWIATHGGLSRFNLEKKTFTNYFHDPEDPFSIGSNMVWRVFVDSRGLIWVGNREGLNRLDPDTGRFSHFIPDPADPESMAGHRILSIFEDSRGDMWFSSVSTGVNKWDRETGKFRNYTHDSEERNSLSNHTLFSIHEDQEGNIWFGTRDGLNRFNPATEQFTRYYESDGLPNNVIYGILNDDEGNLWLSTNNGISKFNPGETTFTNFNSSDGLQSEEFNNGAYYRAPDGEIFFGGISGFNSFYPKNIKESRYNPPLVITDFRVLNEKVITVNSCSDSRRLEFSYRENYLSFEFSSLDFSSPEKNLYAYMLEGVDSDWILSISRRYANYTNLPPGDYTFRVKGTNSDGKWSEETAVLHLAILPAVWQTTWFRLSMIMLAVMIISALYKYKTVAISNRNSELEAAVQERTVQLKSINKKLEQEIVNRKKAEDEIKRIAYYDYLTGLPNRRLFISFCEQEIAACRRNSKSFALMFLDLDKFKSINDRYGHEAGDTVLVETAGRLKAIIRESDIICRVGGDEFILLLKAAKDTRAVARVTEKMIDAVIRPIGISENLFVEIGVSIGITLFPEDDEELDGLVAKADKAMYAAKQDNRASFRFYQDTSRTD